MVMISVFVSKQVLIKLSVLVIRVNGLIGLLMLLKHLFVCSILLLVLVLVLLLPILLALPQSLVVKVNVALKSIFPPMTVCLLEVFAHFNTVVFIFHY